MTLEWQVMSSASWPMRGLRKKCSVSEQPLTPSAAGHALVHKLDKLHSVQHPQLDSYKNTHNSKVCSSHSHVYHSWVRLFVYLVASTAKRNSNYVKNAVTHLIPKIHSLIMSWSAYKFTDVCYSEKPIRDTRIKLAGRGARDISPKQETLAPLTFHMCTSSSFVSKSFCRTQGCFGQKKHI